MIDSETAITPPNSNSGFIPRTPLGKKLDLLRKEAIAEGMRLLSAEEMLEEVQRRRGGKADTSSSG